MWFGGRKGGRGRGVWRKRRKRWKTEEEEREEEFEALIHENTIISELLILGELEQPHFPL